MAKTISKKKKAKLMEEGYKKMAKLNKEVNEERKFASSEADKQLGDY